ncbi:TldD/PmbA family protein [Candidatus Bipolaricaulota bacterium]|nr:TldD/PmbA family protein [Candidatus Bipolaricaulota bacterium]
MLGEHRLKQIADSVLRTARADQTEVLIQADDQQLTRFAENSIHQNVAETNVEVRVRSVIGKRIGVASGNDLREEALTKLVRNAEAIAGLQQENPEFRSLPGSQPAESVDVFSESTATCTAAQRASGVQSILRRSRDSGLSAAGAFSTSVSEVGVFNSLGVSAYHRGTAAHVMTVVMSDDSSGYAAQTSKNVDDLDPATAGRIAVDKALKSRNPQPIEPGAYTVFLEEDAVATMMFFLGHLGLGALPLQEKRSFLTGHLGETITGENITIWDDGLDANGFAVPFDFEGVPRQKVMLIENGVGKNVVYDSFTAGREQGKRSTGHSLPAPSAMGPIPLHMHMALGAASVEEMIASIDRGIWVTRFHYTNPVHPVKTILTGMTRDGTFLIENGKISRPLKNLRFTQSILEAFAHARMLSGEPTLVKQAWGNVATFAPAAVINGFEFTGVTEF